MSAEVGPLAPDGYWASAWPPAEAAAMAAKYEALAAAEAAPAGEAQDQMLRAAAARWPGCLRESQLAGPERGRARGQAAAAGARRPAASREAWDGMGLAALPLWADLHALLRDQREFRAAGAGDLAAFARFVAGGPAAARWPGSAAELAARAGRRVCARQAYLWLASRAGISLAELGAALFGRPGHWDARPGDPPPPLRSYPLRSLGF